MLMKQTHHDNGLGGHLNQLEASRGVEVDCWSHEMAVNSTEYDRMQQFKCTDIFRDEKCKGAGKV